MSSKESKEDTKAKATTASTSKEDPAAQKDAVKQQQLSALEEDDEFEEFPVQDWDDTEAELGKLAGLQPGAAMSGGDRLWEDNWDDDDVEEDFNLQLRKEGAKVQGNSSNAMQQ